MTSPTADPITRKLTPAPSPACPKIRSGRAASALGLLFFLGNFFLWPIFFVIGTVSGLVRIRRQLFPIGFRVRRAHFWNVVLIYVSLGVLIFAAIYGAADDEDISKTVATVLTGVFGGAMVASLLAVSISRLHDRNLSGWWIFFYVGIPAAAIARLSLSHPADWEFAVLVGVIMGFVPWGIFVLGCRAGTIGPNRFGEESPWYRGTRRRRVHTTPAPVRHSPAAQPVVGAASAGVIQSLAPANPAATPPIQACAAATQAPATVTQAPAAEVVSSTVEAQPAQMLPPTAPTDIRGRIRETVGDLISANGRMDSSRYWICAVIQAAYALVAWAVIHVIISDRNISQRAYWISVSVIAFLPAALSMIASSVRRLHDRDLSAWWLPGLLIFFVVSLEAFFLIFDQQFVSLADGSFIFAIWVVAIWQLGRMPGTVGSNRFGPDPLE
jgi:uncharacterized membrane protein YhaH (DUF805 family)